MSGVPQPGDGPVTGAGGVEDPLGPPDVDGELGDLPADDDTAPAPAEAGASLDGGVAPEGGEPAEAPASGGDRSGSSVEELIADLERTTVERDGYLDSLRRNQADFENYRKRVAKQSADDAARAAESLVDKLLPVLDACDGAITHGATEVEPIFAALLGTLEKEGLERIDPVGEAFDPNVHEAVLHEPAQEGDDGTVVSDVLRPGYGWKGRVVRPAMVRVRG